MRDGYVRIRPSVCEAPVSAHGCWTHDQSQSTADQREVCILYCTLCICQPAWQNSNFCFSHCFSILSGLRVTGRWYVACRWKVYSVFQGLVGLLRSTLMTSDFYRCLLYLQSSHFASQTTRRFPLGIISILSHFILQQHPSLTLLNISQKSTSKTTRTHTHT